MCISLQSLYSDGKQMGLCVWSTFRLGYAERDPDINNYNFISFPQNICIDCKTTQFKASKQQDIIALFFLGFVCNMCGCPEKTLTQEMLNKILALCRIRVIFTGYDHRVWSNLP